MQPLVAWEAKGSTSTPTQPWSKFLGEIPFVQCPVPYGSTEVEPGIQRVQYNYTALSTRSVNRSTSTCQHVNTWLLDCWGETSHKRELWLGNYTTLPRLRHLTSSIDSLAAQDSRPALGSKWLCHGLRGPNERELEARLNIYSLRAGAPSPSTPEICPIRADSSSPARRFSFP
jgi:hypothetical protein